MNKIPNTIAREDNGNIQIIFTIPSELITSTKTEVIEELAKDIAVPGFRKGMAPLLKVEEKISTETLTDRILNHLLPSAFADSIKEHNLRPAIHPKFEVTKIGQGSDWEIKATTCELAKIILPKNYKILLEHDKKDQDILIKSLLNAVKINIPKILIEEEVNGRLSQLLSRIEKLGLSLEGYLKSVNKTPETLRSEYAIQAKDAISLELILNEVAKEEKIEVDEKQIDEFIKSTGSDPTKVEKEQRENLKRVILRRSALDKLASHER